MCLQRDSAQNSWFSVQGVTDTEENEHTRQMFVRDDEEWASFDSVFELNLMIQLTPEEWHTELDVVQQEATATEGLETKLGTEILSLGLSMREHMPPYHDARQNVENFWSTALTTENPQVDSTYVSRHYRQGLVQDSSGFSMLLPCTGVIESRVVLCFELFFNVSGLRVYRDLLVTLDTILRDALVVFSTVQGFAADLSYSYVGYTPQVGWNVMHFSADMLDMRLQDVLMQASVRNSNTVDFFRLSPVGVQESSMGGTFIPGL